MNKLNGTKAVDRQPPPCCEKSAEDIFPDNMPPEVREIVEIMFPGARFKKVEPSELFKNGTNSNANYMQVMGPKGPHQFTAKFTPTTPVTYEKGFDYGNTAVQKEDMVNNPAHYNMGGIECIEALEACMSPEAFKGYLKGCVIKYLWRYEHKGKAKEDLQKAEWYLKELIKRVN